MQAQGFKRTIWQLIFPGQIAGLIKSVPEQKENNEYHVRFYNDGIIDCELEFARFNSMHWIGQRIHSSKFLEDLLDNALLIKCPKSKEKIKELFGKKQYSNECLRHKIE